MEWIAFCMDLMVMGWVKPQHAPRGTEWDRIIDETDLT
jgi:hypothetical protein